MYPPPPAQTKNVKRCVSNPVVCSPAAESDPGSRGKGGGQLPIFRASVTLSIPNILMVPGLDEVQQALNRAVECVVSVSRGVGQWSKERISKVGLTLLPHSHKVEHGGN